jgi:periplasmic divalent cation tolerance protein
MTASHIDACEITVTGPTDDTLDRIAHALVDERLIACANIATTPVTSTYRWQGAIEVEQEKRAYLHTRADLADKVIDFVKQRHPYDVPNVIAVPLLAGNPDYLRWIAEETSTAPAAP